MNIDLEKEIKEALIECYIETLSGDRHQMFCNKVNKILLTHSDNRGKMLTRIEAKQLAYNVIYHGGDICKWLI